MSGDITRNKNLLNLILKSMQKKAEEILFLGRTRESLKVIDFRVPELGNTKIDIYTAFGSDTKMEVMESTDGKVFIGMRMNQLIYSTHIKDSYYNPDDGEKYITSRVFVEKYGKLSTIMIEKIKYDFESYTNYYEPLEDRAEKIDMSNISISPLKLRDDIYPNCPNREFFPLVQLDFGKGSGFFIAKKWVDSSSKGRSTFFMGGVGNVGFGDGSLKPEIIVDVCTRSVGRAIKLPSKFLEANKAFLNAL